MCVQVCGVALQSDEDNRFHLPHLDHDHRYAERSQWGVIMTSTAILSSSLSLILLVGSTYASSGELDREKHYQQRGSVSCEALDRNQDGLVSRQEYMQLRDERRAARTKQGYPTRGGNSEARFERIDSNGDNSISREECVAHQAQRMQRRQARQGRYVE